MNIDHIGGGAVITPVSIVCFIISALLFATTIYFTNKRYRDEEVIDYPSALFTTLSALVFVIGFSVNYYHEFNADKAAFTAQLQSNYGVSTEASFTEVTNAATYGNIAVFSDEKGKFEVRPHLDGYNLTFFRVDNGAELKPKS